MPTYRKCDPDTLEQLRRVMAEHHPRLVGAGVTVGALWCEAESDRAGEPIGSTLRHRGRDAYATVRIVPQRDRATGQPDAMITIDEFSWGAMDTEEQDAVLDHELTHLEVVMDGDKPKEDNSGRPKLRMRPHDFEVGWFADVAQRHGMASVECRQAKEVFTTDRGQLYLVGLQMPGAIAVGAGPGPSAAQIQAEARGGKPRRMKLVKATGQPAEQ